MRDYIIKRLLQGVLLVFVVSVLIFSLLHLMPGDPIELLTDRKVSDAKKDELRAKYGLDKPFVVQYFNWVKKALQGDFGTSIRTKIRVSKELEARIPRSLELCGISLLVELLIAVPLGLLSAYKKDSIFDRIVMALSLFFKAIPYFWTAILLILLFGVTLKWLPLNGFETLGHMVMPVASLALGGIASTLRMTKTEVLDVIREKFVTTAYAKGLPKRTVMVRHVLRDALITVTVMVFLSIPWLISGAVIIENIFVIPGMGNLMMQSIIAQDFPVVQACVLLIAVLTVLSNLSCDIVTAALDPRIRVSISGGDR